MATTAHGNTFFCNLIAKSRPPHAELNPRVRAQAPDGAETDSRQPASGRRGTRQEALQRNAIEDHRTLRYGNDSPGKWATDEPSRWRCCMGAASRPRGSIPLYVEDNF